jgi:hypothetical protein
MRAEGDRASARATMVEGTLGPKDTSTVLRAVPPRNPGEDKRSRLSGSPDESTVLL